MVALVDLQPLNVDLVFMNQIHTTNPKSNPNLGPKSKSKPKRFVPKSKVFSKFVASLNLWYNQMRFRDSIDGDFHFSLKDGRKFSVKVQSTGFHISYYKPHSNNGLKRSNHLNLVWLSLIFNAVTSLSNCNRKDLSI